MFDHMITGEIKAQVDRVWDAFWSGGISNSLEVIEQLTYLLFIKRLDELHTKEEAKTNSFDQVIRYPLIWRLVWSPFINFSISSWKSTYLNRTKFSQTIVWKKYLGKCSGFFSSNNPGNVEVQIPINAPLHKIVRVGNGDV